jgi:hypothetical protein
MNSPIQSGAASLVCVPLNIFGKRFTIGAVKQIVCNISKLFVYWQELSVMKPVRNNLLKKSDALTLLLLDNNH